MRGYFIVCRAFLFGCTSNEGRTDHQYDEHEQQKIRSRFHAYKVRCFLRFSNMEDALIAKINKYFSQITCFVCGWRWTCWAFFGPCACIFCREKLLYNQGFRGASAYQSPELDLVVRFSLWDE